MAENFPTPNGNDGQEKNKRDILSIAFGIVSVVAVFVCIVVVITCCITFLVTTLKFSDELRDTLKVIANTAVSTDSSEESLSSSSAATESSSYATTASSSFIATSDSLPEKKGRIENLITHMESMVAIQRSGMTNDLMSFMYGILSTILVGLCAGFVVKSQASADEAKRIASEAKTNIEKAENQAKDVAEKADDAKKSIKKAKEATREAEQNAENAEKQAKEAAKRAKETLEIAQQAQIASNEAKENAQKTDESAKEVTEIVTRLLYQVRLITISSKIMYANSLILELISLIKELKDKDKKEQAFNKKTQANRAIKQIHDEITELFSDEKFFERIHAIDTTELEKVFDQLIYLQQIIDSFSDILKNQQKNPDIESMETAARNYKNWVKNAIKSMLKTKRKKDS